jgi:type IV pilus assembly protein PilN
MIRVNLLGLPKPKKRVKPVITLDGGRLLVLLVVVLILVAVIQFMRYGRLQDEDKKFTRLIQDEQAEKVRLQGMRAEYEKFSQQKDLLTKRINIIEGLKAKQNGPMQLLNMIASTVSDTNSLWLTSFTQTGQRITIDGIALNAKAVADFMTHLKATKAFSDIELKETYQDAAGKEAREIPKFLFTVNVQLANSAPTT